jgi:uracil-DNA glycosylase
MSKVNIEPEWKEVLKDYFQSPEFANLTSFVKSEYNEKTIYPAPEEIFTAFWQTPFSRVRVVILGQDPYHGPNQAHGLSFSVKDGIELPPSLKNIYKEIEQEFGIQKDFKNGNLLNWASQGVFLLNSVLTVVAGLPASHRSKGWENFTDIVIQKLSDERENLVFILWGSFARSKKSLINSNKHLILEGVHPSPLSAHRGFFGCQHFLKCNDYLQKNGQKPIVW